MIPHLSFVVDFIFVYLLGNEILNWQLPFPNRNPMLWILHLSLFWIPVAFLFSGVSNFISLFFGVNFLFLDYPYSDVRFYRNYIYRDLEPGVTLGTLLISNWCPNYVDQGSFWYGLQVGRLLVGIVGLHYW